MPGALLYLKINGDVIQKGYLPKSWLMSQVLRGE